jgi:hypothetical protein
VQIEIVGYPSSDDGFDPCAREIDDQANEKRIVDIVVYIEGPLEGELQLQNNPT